MLITVKYRKRNNQTWAERFFFSEKTANAAVKKYLDNGQKAYIVEVEEQKKAA